MKTICINVYQIHEHPNPDKVYEWIRNNWHDLNSHSQDEFIESLNKLAEAIGGTLDYCLSVVPDRGEYLSIKDYDADALAELDAGECPLTGVCWDADIIEAMQQGNLTKALKALHKSTEYLYSDDGLKELCEANEYHFTENGKHMEPAVEPEEA
jgi:hypothetical protein